MKYSRYKSRDPFSYALGIAPVISLLESQPKSANAVIVSEKISDSAAYEKILKLCEYAKISLNFNDKMVSRIGGNDSVHAVAQFTKHKSTLDQNKNHLVLVNPSDMGNIGTILRSAVAFNIEDVAIIKPAADYYDPKVVRSSMGAIFYTRIEPFSSFEKYSEKYPNRALLMFSLKGGKELSKTQLIGRYSLVFGNEGEGLSDEIIALGNPVYIPQNRKVDSLNLSTAVGIALYHSQL